MNEAPASTRKITLTETGELGAIPVDTRETGAQRRFALLIFCDTEAQMKPVEAGSAVVVGREAPSEIVVADASVSRQHARFSLQDGAVWVEDLGSRNGTFLRGQRIERERLDAGDEVGIGKARVVLAATRLIEGAITDCASPGEGDLVVQNARMKQLFRDAVRAARAILPILILGETGSGKEHVAAAIHREGPRKDKPFVVVNCGAIPASLLETTLFGHERGAFTGAASRVVGVFERADGGVLFLDEVGELTSGAQVALLRALETRKISRVGGSSEIPVDVRIVAATHCDLEGMIEEGTFRQDLYFRLSGVQLDVPPLRERLDEIEPLARFFLARVRTEWNARAREMTPEALEVLRRYAWPGNVRQLRHAIERSVLLGAGDAIAVTDLPEYVFASASKAPQEPAPELAMATVELALRQQVQRYERLLIDEALRRGGGNRQVAAKLLRIPLRTLFRKMRLSGASGAKEPDA